MNKAVFALVAMMAYSTEAIEIRESSSSGGALSFVAQFEDSGTSSDAVTKE